MNDQRPALIPHEGQPQRRVINLPPPKPTKAEIVQLYRAMTMTYWLEAAHLRANKPDIADLMASERQRINAKIMGAI